MKLRNWNPQCCAYCKHNLWLDTVLLFRYGFSLDGKETIYSNLRAETYLCNVAFLTAFAAAALPSGHVSWVTHLFQGTYLKTACIALLSYDLMITPKKLWTARIGYKDSQIERVVSVITRVIPLLYGALHHPIWQFGRRFLSQIAASRCD